MLVVEDKEISTPICDKQGVKFAIISLFIRYYYYFSICAVFLSSPGFVSI
jgi:hypothetical protein